MNQQKISPVGHSLMLIAIAQSQDAEPAQNALKKLGISSVRMPSVGGFLGRRNVTLLIDLPRKRCEEALNQLKDCCRQRVEFIAVPLESAPLPLPTPTPVTIGGANIFCLEIDHFEEI